MGEMPLWLRRIQLGLQYWVKISESTQTFPARRLLQEVKGSRKFKSFVVDVDQWATKLSMGQRGLMEHTSWSPIPPWVMSELDIEMSFLQKKDKRKMTARVQLCLNSIRERKLPIFPDGSRIQIVGELGLGSMWSSLT